MSVEFKITATLPAKEEQTIVFAGKDGAKIVLPEGIGGKLAATLKKLFKTQPGLLDKGKTAIFILCEDSTVNTLGVFGLGEVKAFTTDMVRHLAGDAIRFLSENKLSQPYLIFPQDFFKEKERLGAFAEGAVLGDYSFEEFKSKKEKGSAKTLTILAPGVHARTAASLLKNAASVGRGVNFARDLINRPGNVVTPSVMAQEAQELAKMSGLSCQVLGVKEMQKLNMGALLSVAKGSAQPPCMIVLEYKGAPAKKHTTAFVGKGITFDSGGISIKPSEGMGEMKDDMGGGAAVLAALGAIAALKLPVNITGIIPCAENMPSGNAARPGDIVKAAAGKTIEIISTDAEGRMLLADAVWYAGKIAGAEKIIDIATLTGAASIALGEVAAGVVTNDQALCDTVMKASKNSGEKCWQMPAFEEFKEYNKSSVADIKNSGGRFGGMITGGLFIGEFTDKPWVHIDIGNTVNSKETKGYNVKGPSGFGVRLLIEAARLL